MTPSTSPKPNGRHVDLQLPPTEQRVALAPPATSEQAMHAERYLRMRASLITTVQSLIHILPERWPARAPAVDIQATLTSLRQATATLNEGLLIIGFGDGTILELLRQDTLSRRKIINIVILAPEAEAFAHSLGAIDFQPVLNELHLGLHYIANAQELTSVVHQIFADHAQIAQLAGTTIMDAHPLTCEAEAMRTSLLPGLSKNLVERYDCLGNDVYDTFLGARNVLMHGDAIFKRPHTTDYAQRYQGRSALCIASGPSGPAHFARIREIQHEHVVICADSILGALLDQGIEPDFACVVERPDNMHRLFDAHAGRCKTVLFALPVVHPSSVAPFADRVAWWWNADELYPWLDPIEQVRNSGRSSGTMTVALAAHLGVATAYLVGHDLAFKDGQSHCACVAPMALETQGIINRDLSRANPNYYRRVMDVARNGGGALETMGIWEIFRSDIELITEAYQASTSFVNLNIGSNEGAVIARTVAGALPAATGTVLEKSHPSITIDEAKIARYRARCLSLLDEFASCETVFQELEKRIAGWRPLGHDRAEVEALSTEMDLTTLVSAENRTWFTYVFRAALRNLMVRLHHNTFVRTMAERNWNQIQVMRLYLHTIPALIRRLRCPELAQALESFGMTTADLARFCNDLRRHNQVGDLRDEALRR